MTPRNAKAALTLALAGALWVVPSLGTQGMGTIRQRFVHPDRSMIIAHGALSDAAAQRVLQTADQAVEAAVTN